MTLRSLIGKLRIPAFLQRVAGSRRVASQINLVRRLGSMTLRSLIGKLRIPAFLQRVAGSRRVASQDKMSSSAFARTTDPTAPPFDSYDELLRSSFERVEKEARRQRRAVWKAVLGAEAAALLVAFGGLCYVADNNRVEP